MKFEVFDDKRARKYWCKTKGCLPKSSEITSMAKAGYRFKLDGKAISKTALLNYIKKEEQ